MTPVPGTWGGSSLSAWQDIVVPVGAILLLWFVIMAITGIIASRQGRDDGVWALIAFFTGPVALLALLLVPRSWLRRSAADPTASVPASAPSWPTRADGWVRLEYPPPPIQTEQRLFGALLGGALGGTGAGVLLMLGGQPLSSLDVIVWAAAGAVVGYLLSGELIGVAGARLVGVGLGAGALAIVMAEVIVGVMRAIPDLSMGAAGVFTIVLAVAGSIVSPFLYALFAQGMLGAAMAGGLIWAAATSLVLRRGTSRPVQSPATAA